MMTVMWVVVALLLLFSVWLTVLLVRNQRPAERSILVLFALAVVVLIIGLVFIGTLIAGRDITEPATLIGYAASVIFFIPIGFVLSRLDQGRWGTGFLLIALLAVAVMLIRCGQLWELTV